MVVSASAVIAVRGLALAHSPKSIFTDKLTSSFFQGKHFGFLSLENGDVAICCDLCFCCGACLISKTFFTGKLTSPFFQGKHFGFVFFQNHPF